MSEDRLFASGKSGAGSFRFDDSVASVFPDMLRRSIPGYEDSIRTIGCLARRFVRPDTLCFDLGCSLGAATLAMRHNIAVPGCRIVAIDSSIAMTRRCERIIAADDVGVPVDVLTADVRDAAIKNASMVVMNYTLHFLPLGDRDAMIAGVCSGTNEGGVFVLSEKVVDDDDRLESLLVDLHHQEKKRNFYSDAEIAGKRAAIENVLVPESVATHRERLQRAGFRHVGVWLRHFNFVSLLAIK